jgi:signal transduction histidine kinase
MIRSFYSKLSLTLVTCFVVMGGLLVSVVSLLSHNYQNEVTQKLHAELATYLVKDSAELRAGRFDYQALKSTFHTMMMLGPSFEFYLLSPSGEILTYDAEPGKVQRSYVDLAPLKAFMSNTEALPIKGDDPRNSERSKIFSVAEINNEHGLQGYLYIIIGGEKYDDVVTLLQDSHITYLGVGLVASIVIFGLFVSLILFRFLTRPLSKLSQNMDDFSERGFDHPISSQVSTQCLDSELMSGDEVDRLDARFQHMASTLKGQYDQIKNTDALRRELISYVSHDLRTPLASLQGYLETWQLNHQSLSEEASKQLIDVAERNALQVSRLVEQLFELAHLESATIQLAKESVSIAELVSDIVQAKALDAERKGVSLRMSMGFENLNVEANVERLERVFTNLIDNALRHCHQGDEVIIELAQVHKRSRKQQDNQADVSCVDVRIRDSGCGIPQDALAHIFNPHFKAPNSVSGASSGSGLGLAIVRRILALHDSTIQVTSELGQGTEFTFQLATN